MKAGGVLFPDICLIKHYTPIIQTCETLRKRELHILLHKKFLYANKMHQLVECRTGVDWNVYIRGHLHVW